MIRRFVLAALALNALYAAAWLSIGERNKLVFERWAVAVAVTVAFVAYALLAAAYLWARKTRLNSALALNKAMWGLLIGALVMPSTYGVLWRDAPYRVVGNPYSFWIAPAWFRTWCWVFLAVSIVGVLYEFVRANVGAGRPIPPAAPAEDRVLSGGPGRGAPRPAEAVRELDD